MYSTGGQYNIIYSRMTLCTLQEDDIHDIMYSTGGGYDIFYRRIICMT